MIEIRHAQRDLRGWSSHEDGDRVPGLRRIGREEILWTRASRSAKIHSVPIHDQTRPGNDVMRLRSLRIIQRALGAGGMAALLLAIGALGAAAPGQDGAKPPQGKDQPKPAKGKDDAPKQDDSKPAPVKLGLSINDPKALQGYTLISPFDSSKTFLLDMQGRVVRSWETGCAPALSAFPPRERPLDASRLDRRRQRASLDPDQASAGGFRSSPGTASWSGTSSSTTRSSFLTTT